MFNFVGFGVFVIEAETIGFGEDDEVDETDRLGEGGGKKLTA